MNYLYMIRNFAVRDDARRLLCLALALGVLIVFGRLAFFDFIYFDDRVYVMEKAQVLAGLTRASVYWAFTATDAGFWHPLTWLSLMADHEIWGLNPGGYHITNVLLHLTATLILFVALSRMTNTIWESFFVAALFAFHPLHVESVAWIAQRKDVLSGFFWMLSLLLYARYVQRPGIGRYVLMLASFAMGLMSKPMVVTLPMILLLLDVWPLGRLYVKNWKLPVVEKIPMLIMGISVGLLTIPAQQQVGALKSFAEFSLVSRLSNAIAAYGFYLYKTILPFGLCVYYPHPGYRPIWILAASLVILTVITVIATIKYKRYPFVPIGWLWYLVGLIPVIGFIQIGSHAYADRYSYLPLIGVFIAVVWGMAALVEGRQARRLPVAVGGAALVVAFMLISVQQVGYWRDAETLFRRAVAVTQDNYLARNNLGAALSRQGRHAEAVGEFNQALKIRPNYLEARFNLGVALAGNQQYEESLRHYRIVIALNPEFAQAHNNIGIAYARLGNLKQALFHFREAIRINPAYADAIDNKRIAGAEKSKAAGSAAGQKQAAPHLP